MITIVWILSALGVIASAVSIIISTICSSIGVIAGMLPLLQTSPEANNPSQLLLPRESKDEINSLPQIVSPINSYRTLSAILPNATSKVIVQREQAVKEVYEQIILPDATAVVLTGIGGVGKSTLASLVSYYAERLRQQGMGFFTAPVLWLQIVASATIEDIIATIYEADAKPVPDLGHLAPADQVRHLFSLLNTNEKSRLIILDQFEYLLDWDTGKARIDRPGIGEWIDAMNSQPCRCRLLITSRRWPVGIRDYPPVYMREYCVEKLTVIEGKELLRRLGIQATDAELGQVIEYCEGHPYALIFCASLIRLHHITLSTLLNDPAYVQLWAGNVARNLLDSIGLQLGPLQREVLLACAIFREPVLFDALWAVMEPDSAEAKMHIQFALETLLSQHLLQTASLKAYQLHAIVSNYVREHLIADNEQANRQTLRQAHQQAAKYYIQLAAKRRSDENEHRGLEDMHNWLEAVWQLCQAELYTEAYALIRRENIFTVVRQSGGNAVILEFCQLLLASKQWELQPGVIAYLYNSLGDAYGALGQNEQALTYYQQMLTLSLEDKKDLQIIHALSNSGRILNTLGNTQQGQAYLEQAQVLLEDMQDSAASMDVFVNLGWIYYDQGQMGQARNYFEQALRIAQELKDKREEGIILGYLGRVAVDSGQKWLAKQYYIQAVMFLQHAGDRNGEATMLANLGRVTHVLGDSKQGQHILEQALGISRETGDRNSEATVTNDLGMLYAETGQKELAKEYFEQSLQLRRAVKNLRGESRVLIDLGNVYMDEGMVEKAKACFEQALQILRAIGPGWREVRPLKKLGNVYAVLNQYTKALAFYNEAIHICRKVGDRWEESNLFLRISLLYLAQKQDDIALAFLLQAQNIADEIKSTDREKIEQNIINMRSKVGEEQFRAMLEAIIPQKQQMTEDIVK